MLKSLFDSRRFFRERLKRSNYEKNDLDPAKR